MFYKPSFAMAVLLAASCGAQAASDSDLAADLTKIRSQIDEMKKSYEQRIAALEKKLVEAEVKNQPPATAQPVVVESSAPASRASGFNPEVSLILQGQYKDMKNVPERQISGFVSAGGHDHDEAESDAKRGFSVDHTELVFAANIDPNWRGQAIIAALDGSVEVEEAWFQSLGMGYGLGLKGGRLRSGIGYLNEQHPHAWDFADAPLMYQAMFGEHGSYTQDGVQLKWLAPTPVFLEFGAEFGRGANFPGSDRNKNGSGSGALFAHLGGDLGVANNWRAGVSWLKTSAQDRESHFEDTVNEVEAMGAFTGDSTTWLADFVWKWSPSGNPKYQNFKFQSEYFLREEKGELTCGVADAGDPVSCDGITSAYRTRQSGWYAQGVYQFTPQWRAGVRVEQLNSGTRDFGENADYLLVDSYRPKKASAMVDYSWSEFSRARLQVAQDKSMLGVTDNQITVQYIMSLGAHGAHKF
ncbi:MAG: TonB-dependent receptor [Rhodocyclaceae bacterium]|nr:TonB-dependent receptor [Rhodocyclaceae bacterium]